MEGNPQVTESCGDVFVDIGLPPGGVDDLNYPAYRAKLEDEMSEIRDLGLDADEFSFVVDSIVVMRYRHDGLCALIDTGTITAGEFWDADQDLTDEIFSRIKRRIGSDRYEAIFNTQDTRAPWMTREQFIEIMEFKNGKSEG